jgi:hypothetical protein
VKGSTRWAIGCAATVVAFLVGGYALMASFFATAGCPIFRPGDLGAGIAGERLELAVSGLPGVVESRIQLSSDMCESTLDVRVTFDQAATSDQVAAVVRRTVDGLQAPELVEFDGDASFRHDRGPDPAFYDGWFNLRWSQDTRSPAGSLLGEERAWADLHERYPGSHMSVANHFGTWEREVTVLLPDGDSADAVSEAFGVLRGLPFPVRDEMSWQVCIIDDPAHLTVRSCEQIEGALPLE